MSEHQQVEWKSSWRDEYLKWICGFANAQGGVLEIGRRDDGRVVGVESAARLLEELPNKLRDLLGVVADVDLLEEEGKPYLRIVVEPYPVPISYRGEYHYRSGSTKQVLTGAALDRFLLSKTGRRWDGVPVPGVSVEDLDGAAVTRFRERAVRSGRMEPEALSDDDAGLLDKLRLLEGHYLKRAAILLFHRDPERFVTGAAVKIGYFASESDLRYHDEITGDLFGQVDKTVERLLTKYLRAGIRYEGIQRIESHPMPESALREALLNAIVHRDYAIAAPIQIRVYANRLRIWNPGELPANWSEAKLLGPHPSQPFNPDIANAFFRAGEIEAWGRGIQRILEACRQAAAPAPRIHVEPGDFWFEFPFSDAYLRQIDEGSAVDSTETTQQAREKTREKTREKILRLIRRQPSITMRELAEEVGITVKGIEWQLGKLKAGGTLRRVGSDRGGHWEVLEERHE